MYNMNTKACVYRIVSTVSGKCYNGWAKSTPQRRFDRHCRDAKSGSMLHFHCAIRKYGTLAWQIIELAKADTFQEAKRLETFFIAQYRSNDRTLGYNMTIGGDGMIDPTGEIAKKISATLKGRGKGIPKSSETRQRMRGRITTAEARENMSRAQRGHPTSDVARARMSRAKLGKKRGPWSPEHRQKVSKSVAASWSKRRKSASSRSGQMPLF
jgi:group I intron endonuclease